MGKVAVLSPSKLAPGLATVLALSVAARVLTQVGLGTYVTLAAIVAFCTLVFTSPGAAAVTRYGLEHGSQVVRYHALRSAALTGVVSAATAGILIGAYVSVEHMVLLGVAAAGSSLLQIEVAWQKGRSKFKAFQATLVASALLRIAAVALLAVGGVSTASSLYAIPLLVGSAPGLALILPRLLRRRAPHTGAATRHYARSLGFVTVALASMSMTDRLLLPLLLPLDAVGEYGSLYSAVEFSSGAAMAVAWTHAFPTATAEHVAGSTAWLQTRQDGARGTVALIAFIGTASVGLSPIWVPVLLDRAATASGILILGILSVSFLLYALSEFTLMPLHFQGGHGRLPRLAGGAALVNVVLLLILSPILGTLGAAVSTMLAYLTMFAMAHAHVDRPLSRSVITLSLVGILLVALATASALVAGT